MFFSPCFFYFVKYYPVLFLWLDCSLLVVYISSKMDLADSLGGWEEEGRETEREIDIWPPLSEMIK